MSAQSDPRRTDELDVDSKYYYRRSLSVRELMPAVGAAVGAALVTFYVVRVFIQRTPLRLAPNTGDTPRLTLHRRGRASVTARNAGRQ